MASSFTFRSTSNEQSPLARKSTPHGLLTRDTSDSPHSLLFLNQQGLSSGWNDENAHYVGKATGRPVTTAPTTKTPCAFGAIGEPVVGRSRHLGLTTSDAYISDSDDSVKDAAYHCKQPASKKSLGITQHPLGKQKMRNGSLGQRLAPANIRSISLGTTQTTQSRSELSKQAQCSDDSLQLFPEPTASKDSTPASPLPDNSMGDSLDSAGAFEIARLREELDSARIAIAHYRDEALRARLASMVQDHVQTSTQQSHGLTKTQLDPPTVGPTRAQTFPISTARDDEFGESRAYGSLLPSTRAQPYNVSNSASPLNPMTLDAPLPAIGSRNPDSNSQASSLMMSKLHSSYHSERGIASHNLPGQKILSAPGIPIDQDSDRLYPRASSVSHDFCYSSTPSADLSNRAANPFPTSNLSPTASEFTAAIYGPDPWNKPNPPDVANDTWSRLRSSKHQHEHWNRHQFPEAEYERATRRQPYSAPVAHDMGHPYEYLHEAQNAHKDQRPSQVHEMHGYPSRELIHGQAARANQSVNYSRLLEDDTAYNWAPLVHKIVVENDQQASIFLQQKLKLGTAEQKQDMVEAIISQVYALMTNRFGNFLVQRCFDHGTPTQVSMIANAIQGRVVELSMDAFGCHVVQKAFDSVTEDYRAAMVHELLCRIPETVMHRYACHVWQKLFELRWTGDPPQIMPTVNAALRGQWERVAQGETSSLVVQNIFENCNDVDKRPVIEEILMHIDRISRGQFGNWCIQHICEHADPIDRDRAINHIIRMAADYSMDQYASKIIEKMLKVGGPDFLDRYLERLCEVQLGRPRVPLIDVAGDQYGNYLIQYIMDFTAPKYHELIADHVRRHMVSLRGSKFGSRVAARCCEPEKQIRAGPPARAPPHRYNNFNSSTYYNNGGGFGNHYR